MYYPNQDALATARERDYIHQLNSMSNGFNRCPFSFPFEIPVEVLSAAHLSTITSTVDSRISDSLSLWTIHAFIPSPSHPCSWLYSSPLQRAGNGVSRCGPEEDREIQRDACGVSLQSNISSNRYLVEFYLPTPLELYSITILPPSATANQI